MTHDLSQSQPSSRFGVLRIKSFRYFFFAEFTSSLGSAAAPLGLAFGALQIGGTSGSLGLILGAQVLPVLLTLTFGSVWVDRLSRKHVLVAANSASAVSQALAGVLLISGTATVASLAVIAFVSGAATSIRIPATYGFIPTLVQDVHLEQANALSKLAVNIVAISGAALGGLLVAVTGPGWALVLDAGTFLVAASLLTLTATDPKPKPAAPTRILTELADGWSEFRRQTWLWPVVLQFAIVNICYFGGYSLLGPIISERYFDGAASWAIVVTANAIGTVIGALIAIKLRPARPMFFGVCCVAGLALPLIGLGLSDSVWLIAALALAAGLLFEVFDVQYSSTLQRHVPLDMIGRVSAYDGLVSFGALSLGYVLVGLAAEIIDPLTVAVFAGCAVLIATVLTLCAPGVRELRR